MIRIFRHLRQICTIVLFKYDGSGFPRSYVTLHTVRWDWLDCKSKQRGNNWNEKAINSHDAKPSNFLWMEWFKSGWRRGESHIDTNMTRMQKTLVIGCAQDAREPMIFLKESNFPAQNTRITVAQIPGSPPPLWRIKVWLVSLCSKPRSHNFIASQTCCSLSLDSWIQRQGSSPPPFL